MVGDTLSGETFPMVGRASYLLSEADESTDVLTRFLLPACLDGLKLLNCGLPLLFPPRKTLLCCFLMVASLYSYSSEDVEEPFGKLLLF